MDGASDENTSAQENIDQMLDMVVDIYNNQFTKDDLLDRLHAPDAVENYNNKFNSLHKDKWTKIEKRN